MFSNQYMGTRVSAKTMPRIGSSFNFTQSGPYSRLNSEQPPRPVNSKDRNDDDVDGVDYSFMNLPVRERRKLFMSAGPVPMVQRAQMYSMTMPRQRNAPDHTHFRHETQSDYGDDSSAWESTITPTWVRESRNARTFGGVKSRSSRTFNLTHNNPSTAPPQPFSQQQWYEPVDRQIHGSSGQYSPRRNHDSYTINPPNTVRVFCDRGSRVFPAKHTTTVSSTKQVIPSVNYNVHTPWKSPSIGRVGQPLRVNVYNSDNGTTVISPQRGMDSSQVWSATSPIYPAYPAHMERSVYVMESQPIRHRREQSVQPVTIHKINRPVVETKQTWRAMQAPKWLDDYRSTQHRTYVTASATSSKPNNPTHYSALNESGVSDF